MARKKNKQTRDVLSLSRSRLVKLLPQRLLIGSPSPHTHARWFVRPFTQPPAHSATQPTVCLPMYRRGWLPSHVQTSGPAAMPTAGRPVTPRPGTGACTKTARAAQWATLTLPSWVRCTCTATAHRANFATANTNATSLSTPTVSSAASQRYRALRASPLPKKTSPKRNHKLGVGGGALGFAAPLFPFPPSFFPRPNMECLCNAYSCLCVCVWGGGIDRGLCHHQGCTDA